MKKIFLPFILCCLIVSMGCGDSGMKIPKGNKGSASQQETEKKKVYGEIDGEIELPSPKDLPQDINCKSRLDPWKFKVDGVDVEVPYGTKGKLKIRTKGSSSFNSFTEMMSSWKVNSAPVQLFIFGSVIVAVGVGLIIFGMRGLGIACIGGGLAIITCGVLINQYPWVFLLVVGICLLFGAYFIYNQYFKKKISVEVKDQSYVLEILTDLIAKLPEEIREQYFKKPLKEDDQSSVIREITRKARGLTK